MMDPGLKPSRAALREALLAAAEEVIARDGFGALRARGLTEAVGCALGALYTAFADMDALMLAVKLRILDRLDARVADSLAGAAAEGAGSGDAQPLAMAQAYLDFAWDERRRWEVLFQHHLSGPGELPVWYRERLGGIFARIAGPLNLALPGLSGAEALRLAHSLFAAVHGMVALDVEAKLGPSSRAETAARVAMLVRATLAGLRADPELARVPQRDDAAVSSQPSGG